MNTETAKVIIENIPTPKWKRNLIQVLPEFRHLFRGQEHTLYIFEPELNWEYKRGGSYAFSILETE